MMENVKIEQEILEEKTLVRLTSPFKRPYIPEIQTKWHLKFVRFRLNKVFESRILIDPFIHFQLEGFLDRREIVLNKRSFKKFVFPVFAVPVSLPVFHEARTIEKEVKQVKSIDKHVSINFDFFKVTGKSVVASDLLDSAVFDLTSQIERRLFEKVWTEIESRTENVLKEAYERTFSGLRE